MIEIGLETVLKIPKLYRKKDLVKYAILSWYLPEWTKFELQEFLRQKSAQLHFPEVGSYIYSKEVMLASLYRENDYKKNDLFGNILQKGVFVWQQTSSGRIRIKQPDLCFISTKRRKKARPKVYRRGYNDHGSLPPEDIKKARIEIKKDINLELEQAKIELRRTVESQTASILIMEGIIWLRGQGIEC